MCSSEVKLQLKKKLTHLEKETQIMKQELFHNTKERKTLLSEVYQQLKLIQFSLQAENQTEGYKFSKKRGRSDGLSQVLYEDWNPSIVIRGSSVAASGAAESSMSNFLSIEYNS